MELHKNINSLVKFQELKRSNNENYINSCPYLITLISPSQTVVESSFLLHSIQLKQLRWKLPIRVTILSASNTLKLKNYFQNFPLLKSIRHKQESTLSASGTRVCSRWVNLSNIFNFHINSSNFVQNQPLFALIFSVNAFLTSTEKMTVYLNRFEGSLWKFKILLKFAQHEQTLTRNIQCSQHTHGELTLNSQQPHGPPCNFLI